LIGITFLSHYDLTSDQVAALGTDLTFGIFILAAVGGVIALVSYAKSSARPDVVLECYFRDSARNRLAGLEFDLETGASLAAAPPSDSARPIRPATLVFSTTNTGEATAYNVIARCVFSSDVFFQPELSRNPKERWTVGKNNNDDWTVQWRSGPGISMPARAAGMDVELELAGLWVRSEWSGDTTLAQLFVTGDDMGEAPTPFHLMAM
jgi:hypothetical protein